MLKKPPGKRHKRNSLEGGEISMHRLRLALRIVIALLMVAVAFSVSGDDLPEDEAAPLQTPYVLENWVIGCGGSPTADSSYAVNGTAGQSTPVGITSAGDKVVYAGFWSAPWTVASVLEAGPGPAGFVTTLFQNSPNPFRFSTAISFVLREKGTVEICVYNVRGQRVRSLVSESRTPGPHVVTWEGQNDRGEETPPGVYFYMMRAGAYRSVKKMVRLR
jgi:hypothetical protein